MERFDSLQAREIFHLEFLRWLSRKVKTEFYALKGGVNLRFFFKSLRYSEDIDLDIRIIAISRLRDIVMEILRASSFQDVLEPFGIVKITPPDLASAKQTATTQRFKIHLAAKTGEDLLTKIEFSRRGFKGKAIVQPVDEMILRAYKLPPLLVPHYDFQAAVFQKIEALAGRASVQARDVFDLYVLGSQGAILEGRSAAIDSKSAQAFANMNGISFEQFRDTVIPYLVPEDQAVYNSLSRWVEIKLKVAGLLRRG